MFTPQLKQATSDLVDITICTFKIRIYKMNRTFNATFLVFFCHHVLNLSKNAFCFTKQCLDVVICMAGQAHPDQWYTGAGYVGLVMPCSGPGGGWVAGRWCAGWSLPVIGPAAQDQWMCVSQSVTGHIPSHNTHSPPPPALVNNCSESDNYKIQDFYDF